MNLTTYFLNHIPPYPDETLVSWMSRLSQANYLQPVSLLTSHLRQQIPTTGNLAFPALNFVHDQRILEVLAQLSMSSMETIQAHTIHRLAHLLYPPAFEAESCSGNMNAQPPAMLKHPTSDFYTPHLSWCPQCLSQAAYVRWHWHIPLVLICPEHHSWLRQTCPECGCLTDSGDVLRACCQSCGFNLCQAESSPLPEDELLWQLQTILLHWMYGTSPPAANGLPDAPVNVLLYLLHGLRYSAQRAGQHWFFHYIPSGISIPKLDIVERRRLTSPERASLYCTALRGLLDWPQGFYTFLDAYRQRPYQGQDKGLRREFGVLYISWLRRLWQHSSFGFLHHAFNDYLLAHVSPIQIVNSQWVIQYPDLLNQLDYLNVPAAARHLGLPERRIHRLVQQGIFTVHRSDQYTDGLLSRQELNHFQSRCQHHLTRYEAAAALGISTELVHDLIQVRLLEPVPLHEGTRWEHISLEQHKIDALLIHLKEQVICQPHPGADAIYLTQFCVRYAATLGLKFAHLLQRIYEGKLRAYHAHPSLLPLGMIWLLREEIQHLPALLKQERGWLTLTETFQCLNVKRHTLQHFIEAGLLSAVAQFGPKQFFDKQEVLHLKDRVVSARTATTLLHLPLRRVCDLAHYRIITPISGPGVNRHTWYFFDRYDLLNWREKYVLFSELRTTHSAHPTHLQQVRQQLQPAFTDIEIYDRKEVMALFAN